MRSTVSAAFVVAFVFSSTASHSQTGSTSLHLSQAGNLAIGSPRQQPNVEPTAPTRPAADASAPQDATVALPPASGYAWAGGTFFSGITVGTFYDDNVFASHVNRQSDVAVLARPEFAWAAQGQNFTVGADGYLEGRRYVRFNSEDQLNGSFGTNFTYMPDSDTQVVGSGRYLRGHLDRGSSETIVPGGILLSTSFNDPVAYDEGLASIALNKRYGRWWTSIGAAGLGVNYQNPAITGTAVDLSYADGGIGIANGRVGYVVMPQTSAFIEVAGNARTWKVDAFDSTGYRVVGGALFEQGPKTRLRGEVWAGYMNQNYSGSSFQAVSNWTYGASLAFLFTDQLTGVIEGKREAKEAALSLALIAPGVVGASTSVCASPLGAVCVSAIESIIGGRLEYRILPNVALGAGASFMVDEYLGSSAGHRSDRTLSPLASIKYFPNDKITLGFDYRRINFDPVGGEATGVSAISYYRDVYLLSMNGKF